MNYFSEISRIIDYGLNCNQNKLISQVQMLAKQLKKNGEHDEAESIVEKISKTLNTNNLYTQKSFTQKPVPVEKDNRFPLADYEVFSENDIWLALSKNIEDKTKQFLSYIQHKEKLASAGIPVNPTMLLHGSPGTGKSKLAAYIAAQLSLPLITARSDALISSYLGSTSKNIRMLMNYAQERECVLFLDEFDALAKGRDDSNEVGELKRVVVSLLQNIDALDNVILIAATNHPHLLDRAVWRRFHYKIEMPLPDEDSRKAIVVKWAGESVSQKTLDLFSTISNGISGAELESLVLEYKREYIVNEYKDYENENRLLQLLISYQQPDITFLKTERKREMMYVKDKYNISAEKVALIFGLSKQYVSKIVRKVKEDV